MPEIAMGGPLTFRFCLFSYYVSAPVGGPQLSLSIEALDFV